MCGPHRPIFNLQLRRRGKVLGQVGLNSGMWPLPPQQELLLLWVGPCQDAIHMPCFSVGLVLV
jgi:hypothetical protein